MNVLVVDDDASTLNLLEKNLTRWGYGVVTAPNGRRAMEMIAKTRVDMVVSDWLMPEINGLELCHQVRGGSLDHYVYIILISAQNDRKQVLQALQSGVDDFIAKPLNLEELHARLIIGARIVSLESELNQKYLALKRNYYQTIQLFTHMVETYDVHLGSHCRRVGQLALEMAEHHPDVEPEAYPLIEAAGYLHDIGLIGLPFTLLDKRPTEMSGKESDHYRSHPERGEQLLLQVDLLKPVARMVRSHHEQYNGRGFPDGLSGDQLSEAAAIVGAANLYDNLVYRQKINLEAIPENLLRCRGYQLSPAMVGLLLDINLTHLQQENDQTDRLVLLNELSDGMVLSRDVLMKTGAFIMASGSRLDTKSIDKLKRYVEFGHGVDKVFVKK